MQLEKDSLLKKLRALWTCPLSHAPVIDPVVTVTGYTCERKALSDWLRTNKTDPFSKTEPTSPELIPNATLLCVINLLESELPELESQLNQSQTTIKELDDKIASIRQILEQQREKESDSEELLETTTERARKTKKIRKEEPRQKEIENSRLREVLAENKNLKKLVEDLQNKERQNEQKIEELKSQIQQISEQRDTFSMEKGMVQYNLNISQAIRKEQRTTLDELTSLTNNHFWNSYEYNQRFESAIQEEFKKLVEGHGIKHLVGTDVVRLAQFSVLTALESERASINVKRGVPRKGRAERDKVEQLINFCRVQSLMRRKLKRNILSMTSIYDNEHLSVYCKMVLNAIPFSCPASEEQLQIDWSNVGKIQCFDPVDQDKWKELIKNIEKFPSLEQLEIGCCNMANMTDSDLEKLKKLRKISFKNAKFTEETQKNLTEFIKKYSWIEVDVKRP